MSYKNIYPKFFLMIALAFFTIALFPKTAHSGHTVLNSDVFAL